MYGSSSSSLTRADASAAQYFSQVTAGISSVAEHANNEVAKVGAHAVTTMAQLSEGAGAVQRRLTVSGHSSPVYDDAHNKILQVTGQNIITLANTAQQQILRQAASLMR